MKILSLKQPWAWMMTHGIPDVPMKDIENRKWSTSYRGPVLVQASKNWDNEVFPRVPGERNSFEPPDFLYFLNDDKALIKVMPELVSDYPVGGVVGMFTITDCVNASKSPWFFGPYGFVVDDQKPLPFTPWKGQLGLRDAPAELLALLGLDEDGKEVKV